MCLSPGDYVAVKTAERLIDRGVAPGRAYAVARKIQRSYERKLEREYVRWLEAKPEVAEALQERSARLRAIALPPTWPKAG